ncbi:MAG: hypothetical protein N2646_01365 [Bellilinea sp.]|nr:hypothetical protein [Bellilinea sp.]
MRRILLLLSILAFMFCLAAGFILAQKSLNSMSEQGNSNDVARSESSYQQNILLIHVDELEKNQPALISVWGLILYFPEPKIILQPIYPSPIGAERFPLNNFKITQTKNLNSRFIQQVSLQTQMTWDNYILIDHQALSFFTAELFSGDELYAPDQTNGIISVERAYFSQLCNRLVEMEQDGLQQLRWKHLIPDHWRSNLSFDDALLNWEKLTSPQNPVKCEVFGE